MVVVGVSRALGQTGVSPILTPEKIPILTPERATISKNRVGFSEKTLPMRTPDPSQFWGIWGSKENGFFWGQFKIDS